jgi:integrase
MCSPKPMPERCPAWSGPLTFERAGAEWLRYCVEDRACKPSTMVDYRHTVTRVLVPIVGPLLLEDITAPAIETWRASLTTAARTRNKQLTILNGIFRRAQKRFGLQRNPVVEIERMREPRQVNLDVFSPEEVMALVRAAESEQDAAIYLTAAFTGLRRGELVALRWRDVNFAGCVIRVRADPAQERQASLRANGAAGRRTLARLGRTVTDDGLVFLGEGGGYLDGSALRRRYKLALERAGLRSLRFHDLQHTFGTRAISKADILRVKEWMGHADVATTMRYLHYVPRPEDARLIAAAFEIAPPTGMALSAMPSCRRKVVRGTEGRGRGGRATAVGVVLRQRYSPFCTQRLGRSPPRSAAEQPRAKLMVLSRSQVQIAPIADMSTEPDTQQPEHLSVALDTPLLTAEQVAQLLAVPRSSVYEYARRQHDPLPSIASGGTGDSTAPRSRGGWRLTPTTCGAPPSKQNDPGIRGRWA